MAKQSNKDAKRDAKILREYAALGIPTGPPAKEAAEVSKDWASDLVEMKERIEREGERAVPNRDRDTLAKGLPRGSATRRDGTSVRPVYDEEKQK